MSHLVVLVEDDPDHARLTERALSRGPLEVDLVHADSADVGVERIERRSPDLVLLDLDLGSASGLEVLEALRSQPATACVPVVVLSTSTAREDRRRCYLEGANSFVPRPVEYDELEDRLERVAEYWLTIDAAPEPSSG